MGYGEACESCGACLGISREKGHFRVDYGEKLEPILRPLEKMLSEDPKISARYPARWLAIKLMENDSEAHRLVGLL